MIAWPGPESNTVSAGKEAWFALPCLLARPQGVIRDDEIEAHQADRIECELLVFVEASNLWRSADVGTQVLKQCDRHALQFVVFRPHIKFRVPMPLGSDIPIRGAQAPVRRCASGP